MTISNRLVDASKKLELWMQQQALPLWSTRGINPNNGAVFERLLPDGQPDLSANNRTRVQARQIYVFSVAAQQGWFEQGLPVIADIVNYLDNSARLEQYQAGYAHLLSSKGEILDDKLDAYDFAFFILACAYRYQAFGDLHALHQLNQLLALVDLEFKKDPGGWMEGNYASDKRRQNPHMHLFEAFIACYKATGEGKWLARAGEIFTLFETVFYDGKNQVILEYFHHDWQPFSQAQGQVVEPGHMFEWIWLLREYHALTGTPVSHYCDALYQKALSFGREPGSGLIFDEIGQHGEILSATKRCWPVTEFIKASLAQAKAGDKQAEVLAAEAIELLFEFYLSKNVTGSYIDQLDANNRPMAEHAPASTLYHIMCATVEAVNYCREH
ncbi:AGE family epimerase/isomerase [Thalassomonas sp. RHCl1]|uniref:AGE family epimerase/isomerase n=1 Tax=Thalassomonas sp. RHCl1 TaxID=2995320 RepID=UPI00248BEC0F|nr:AGE family epimerase/isomerase [Thalassomonas sp. RHCl1]